MAGRKPPETRADLQAVIIASLGESRRFGSYFNALTIEYNRMHVSEDSFEWNYITDYYDATSNKLEESLYTTHGTGGKTVFPSVT
ncbi:hypothetical protein Tco_0356481 [Tanacetum coccineum]